MSKRAVLKPGKEKAVHLKHPWIFSGALEELPLIEPGEMLPLFNSHGQFLAQGYFHPRQAIAGRILSFSDEPIETILSAQIDQAILLRSLLFDPKETNCYRLINAEGDGIPGLIVDVYADVLVMQINTCGIERLSKHIVALLIEKIHPQAIYEKSTSSSRRQEGLSDRQGFLYGSCPDELAVRECGLSFLLSLEKGQKTGLFLDQREMRQLIRRYAAHKKVVNCFSYSGGFSLAALAAGAHSVISVDTSRDALTLLERTLVLNGQDLARHETVQRDVFDFLKHRTCDVDLLILDPPAFAKRQADVIAACAGYKEINRLACEKLGAGSFLLTCSCSHFISEELFQNVVFQAVHAAGRTAQILSRHVLAPDHPISLMHPQGGYLKSLLLYLA